MKGYDKMKNLVKEMYVNSVNITECIVNYLDQKNPSLLDKLSVEEIYVNVILTQDSIKQMLIGKNLLTIEPSLKQMIFMGSIKTLEMLKK